MKKKYQITEEEYQVIKEAIIEVLSLWNYEYIEASDETGRSISMNKEVFFDSLKREFIIL